MTVTAPASRPGRPHGCTRREFVRDALRWLALSSLGAGVGSLLFGRRWETVRGRLCTVCPTCPGADQCTYAKPPPPPSAGATPLVWQLDPARCVQCGRCATECVLAQSAVRCVHGHALCGYCRLCFGYFQPGANSLTANAENEICPTGAIRRRFVEDPYYEYTIDESLCIGCGKCVKGCSAFGNGSLFLQVRHNLCLNCNECSIARVCPADAYRRVPADAPYILKGVPTRGAGSA